MTRVPYRARFTTDADDAEGDLYVTIPALGSVSVDFGPVIWSPHGEDLPAEDDLALVVEDDEGVWWVLQWTANGVPGA